MGGLQTQYAPSAYVGLWSRLRDFRRASLTMALEQRRVIQASLMRVTIHMVSAVDFALFAAGIREGRRQWWLRIHRNELEGFDMETVAARMREHLAEGPRRADAARTDNRPLQLTAAASSHLLPSIPPQAVRAQAHSVRHS